MFESTHSMDGSMFDEEFPENCSVSDLCDCGRHKRQHTHAPIPSHKGPFPKSDYMSTFEAVQHPRPRSSKRPPPTARDPRPQPMFLSTNQKDSFKNLGHVERVRPIFHDDSYEPSSEPMAGKTYYSQEFTGKQIKPEAVTRQMDRRELIGREAAQFDGTTTNMQHFKRWVPQPSLTFGELPSFTGSLMYPEKENYGQSTMRNSYVGTWQAPVSPIRNQEATIKIEGDHYHNTTHNTTYQKIPAGDHRAKQQIQKDTTPLRKQGKLQGKSQTMSDFPGYRLGQPRPVKPIDPPPVTIDLRFNNKKHFSTENRSTYQGHDIIEHPPMPSCKVMSEEYTHPSVKFETETSQKRDFQPIDMSACEMTKIKIPQGTMGVPVDAEFQGKTMNNEFFQDWGVQPRIRYGDFHENRPYIPPKEPFQGQSVTKMSYDVKVAEPVKFYRPEQRPMSKSGETNFNTVYKEEFQKKQGRMCRAQVFLIQQELRRRKREKQHAPMSAPHNAHKQLASNPKTVA